MLSQMPSASVLHAASAWGGWVLTLTGFSMPSPCRQELCEVFSSSPHSRASGSRCHRHFMPFGSSFLQRHSGGRRRVPRFKARPKWNTGFCEGSTDGIQHILWQKESLRVQLYSFNHRRAARPPTPARKARASFLLWLVQPGQPGPRCRA